MKKIECIKVKEILITFDIFLRLNVFCNIICSTQYQLFTIEWLSFLLNYINADMLHCLRGM